MARPRRRFGARTAWGRLTRRSRRCARCCKSTLQPRAEDDERRGALCGVVASTLQVVELDPAPRLFAGRDGDDPCGCAGLGPIQKQVGRRTSAWELTSAANASTERALAKQ